MFSNYTDVPGKPHSSQGDTMTKKSTKKALSNMGSYQLAHLLATSLRHENREILVAIKAMTKTNERLEKRVTSLENKVERTAASLRVHRGAHKQRKNRRYVRHRISKTEIGHLCLVWDTYKNNPDKLEAEGKVMAKHYSLHYQRQVVRWFKEFGSWTRADIKAAIKLKAE